MKPAKDAAPVHDADCDRRCTIGVKIGMFDRGTGKVHSLTDCTCKCGINLYKEWLAEPDLGDQVP